MVRERKPSAQHLVHVVGYIFAPGQADHRDDEASYLHKVIVRIRQRLPTRDLMRVTSTRRAGPYLPAAWRQRRRRRAEAHPAVVNLRATGGRDPVGAAARHERILRSGPAAE